MFFLYLKSLVFAVVVMFFAAGVFNYIVDPLNYVRANTNSYYSSERNLKMRMANENKYDGLIVGSSKPSYIKTNEIGKPNSILNASFSAALPEEILYFLMSRDSGEKWVAIGLDWYMFHEKKFPYEDDSMISSAGDIAKYLMSAKTIFYSMSTVYKRMLNRPYAYSVDGSRYITKIQDCSNDENTLKSTQNEEYKAVMDMLSDRFVDFSISKRRLLILSDIKQWGENSGVKIVWWINPYHEDVLNLLKSYHNAEINMLPDMIKNIVGDVIDLSEAYPDRCNYWADDPYHYLPSVGNRMMLNNVLPEIKK